MPADDAGWAAVVEELYARRAAAFTAGDPTALAAVHAPGSPLLTRDTGHLAALRDAGQVVEGFAPGLRAVVSVTVESPDRVRVRLVDALPAHRTGVPDAVTGQLTGDADQVPARADAEVELVLARTDGGWRMSEGGLVTRG